MAKVVVVTGASQGIGQAIAAAFAADGAHVVIAARGAATLHAAAATIRGGGGAVTAVPCDVTAESEVAALVAAAAAITGQLDVVVANAGVARVQPFHEQSLADWDTTLAATLTGTFLLFKHAAPHLIAGSHLFTIGSVASRTAFPNWAAYSAAKWGLLGFTNAVREELRPRGVRVTAVLPGAVNTALWDTIPGTWDRTHMLQPADVARAVTQAAAEPAHISIDEIVLGSQRGAL